MMDENIIEVCLYAPFECIPGISLSQGMSAVSLNQKSPSVSWTGSSFEILLFDGYFSHSAFVSSSLEISCEECFHDFQGFFFGNESCWNAHNVRVVVLASEFSDFHFPRECRTNALVFVAGH